MNMFSYYKKIEFKPTTLLKQPPAVFALLALMSATAVADVTISEFMAINDTTLMDVDGDYEDWIEIHNDSASPVNLAGWFLTDKATELDKWRFPSIVLEADQYLVVFASGKDRRNPRAELHTNFKLSGGEYLALVQPDGTVAYDYSPEYPAQAADISYGTVGGGPAQPLSQGAPASANSPISVSEFNTDYDGWNTPGFTGSVTVIWDSSTTWSTSEGTSDDQHKLSRGYLDDGNSGSGNGLEVTISGIPYATYRVYGLVASDESNGGGSFQCLDFNVNGTWAYGGSSQSTTTAYGNVDANSAHNNGEPWTQIVPGSVIGNYWIMETSGSTCSIIGRIREDSDRGSLTGVIIEQTGAASGALISIDFARDTSDAFFGGQNIGPLATDSPNWHSTLNRDSGELKEGSMTFDVTTSGWQSGHTGIGYDTGSGYGSLIGDNGNVEALTYNKNASIFVRIPFTISDTNSLEQLTLRMKYDDGFRAFLNGTEVAADNAPTPAGWNSTATADRDDALNGDWTAFDLTAHISLLETGGNLLAIQGFNYTTGSSDLLVLPELDAVYDVALSSSYLYESSPGAENGPGATVIGPSIRDTTDWVPRPDGGAGATSMVITSKVVSTLHPIQSVNIHYRYMFGAETTEAMTAIGNDLYTATIPVGGLGEGQMIRWRVEATDDQANKTTDPLFPTPPPEPTTKSYEEYYGTVTIDNSCASSRIPVLEWFIDPANYTLASGRDSGARCSIYYLGRFYDRVEIELHGRKRNDKHSYNLDFNTDNRFTLLESEDKVTDVRWIGNYADKTKLHNTLSHETAARVGAPYLLAFPIRIQKNGAFDRITEMMEDNDDRWLKRLGRDREGALIKMTSETGGEKHTRRPEAPYLEVTWAEAAIDDAAKDELFDSLESTDPTDSRRLYAYDNMNIPDCLNYLVAANLISHQDHGHKNYYIYRDTNNTGEWSIFLWDLDLTWGRNWIDYTYFKDALDADNSLDFNSPLQNKVYNRIYRFFHESPELREMYFRRLRTCMDEILQAPGTPAQDQLLEARFDYWLELIDPTGVATTDADLDQAAWSSWNPIRTPREEYARTKTDYLDPRREFLFNNNPYTLEIYGESAPAMQPGDTVLQIESIDFMPDSGNAMEEYFTLLNTNTYAVDISGWSVTGAVTHVFTPGTVIPSGGGTTENIGRLHVARQSSAFRAKTSGPSSNQYCFVQGGYKGQLSARGETLALLDPTGRLVDQFTYAGTPTDGQQYLRISELMYAPTDPTAAELATQPYLLDTDFEFIELVNTGPTPIDLGGAQFTEGVFFTFPAGFTLAAGGYAIVAANTNAFPLRYGGSATVVGQYDGYLDNSGETIVLLDPVGEKVLDFTYNNSWYPITDGHDFSLVINDKNADWKSWNDSDSWRASANLQGSPGATDPAPPTIAGILVNEVLTHTDLPQVDTIELYNPEGVSADLGGWFLTDDFETPKKFRIPDATLLPSGGFSTYGFDETATPPPPFLLSSIGDEVWLFSANTQSNLTGYVHGFEFGAAENGVSFGRYVTTVGEEHFPAQSALSLGSANAGPKVGPVVISEIMYHPADLAATNNVRDEYIELTNITGSNVLLYDPLATTNTWHLRNAVDFDFPQGSVLTAGSRILVVGFDPLDAATLAAFRAAYGLSTNVPVFGPWTGTLNNAGETIRLKWPDSPNTNSVPYILAEEVGYESTYPWSPAADGTGNSLQRINSNLYGNDPDNWYAALPRPGQVVDPAVTMYIGNMVITPLGYLNMDLHTAAGYRYAVDTTTNLITQPFYPLLEGIDASGDITVITITNLSNEASYYRMRLDP